MSHDHDHAAPAPGTVDWRHNGVRVIKGNQLDTNTRADAGHEPRGGDQRRPRRRAEDLGRHGAASMPTPRPARTIMARWKA